MGPGERFLVFDATGAEHEARLERLGGRLAEATILATNRPARESPPDPVLAPALPKGAKMDLGIEKATELGVRRVAPVVSRYAIGLGVRLERWRRIAVAAAEPCGRTGGAATGASPLDLVLAPALLKGAKMDLVIEKATELGVRRVAPVVSRYAIGLGVRLERWRRIAVAAAEQCGRTSVPAIDAPLPLPELVRAPWPGLRLIAWEGERDVPLTALPPSLPPSAEAVVILVGPEG